MRYVSVAGLYSCILLLISLMLIASCDGCNDDLTDELNNGNDDPEVLIFKTNAIELMRREVWRPALSSKVLPPRGCAPFDLDEDLEASMNIEVRTASIIDGIPSVDTSLYFSANSREPSFFSTGGVIRNSSRWNEETGSVIFPRSKSAKPDTEFYIMVPETGGYELRIEFDFNNCSACCHGNTNVNECNTTQRRRAEPQDECAAGRLSLVYRRVFSEALETRPPSNRDLILDYRDFFPDECRDCDCWEPCII